MSSPKQIVSKEIKRTTEPKQTYEGNMNALLHKRKFIEEILKKYHVDNETELSAEARKELLASFVWLKEFSKKQEALYQSIEALDTEKVKMSLKNDVQLVLIPDLNSPNDRLRPPPLYYILTLLDDTLSEEGFKIFTVLLESSKQILARIQLTYNRNDPIDSMKAIINQEPDTPYEAVINFIIEYPFKNPALRAKLLGQIQQSKRSKEYGEIIKQPKCNIINLAMKQNDPAAVAALVSHGARLTISEEYTEDFINLFEMNISAEKLNELILNTLGNLSNSKKEEFLEKLIKLQTSQLYTDRFPNESVIATAIKHGKLSSYIYLLKLLGFERLRSKGNYDTLKAYILEHSPNKESLIEQYELLFELYPGFRSSHTIASESSIKAQSIQDLSLSLEHLKTEEKLRLEEHPALSSQQRTRINTLGQWLKLQHSNQMLQFLCNSEEEIKRYKELYPNAYYALEAKNVVERRVVYYFENHPSELKDFKKMYDKLNKLKEEQHEIIMSLLGQDDIAEVGLKKIQKKDLADLEEKYATLIFDDWYGNGACCQVLLLERPSAAYALRLLARILAQVKEAQEKLNHISEQVKKLMYDEFYPALNNEQLKYTRFAFVDDEAYDNYHNNRQNKHHIFFLEPTSHSGALVLTICPKANLQTQRVWNYFQQSLNLNSILFMNSFGWDLYERSMQSKYLEAFLKPYSRVNVNVGNHNLNLIDLRTCPNYRFLVNTVLTRSDRLAELVQGDPRFFDFTPFLSACLIDPNTRPFKGGHQKNILDFPVYLALSAGSASILYTGNTDVGSPAGVAGDPITKFKYLNKIAVIRFLAEMQQAMLQTACLTADVNRVTPHYPNRVWSGHAKEQHVQLATPSEYEAEKSPGKLPVLSPDSLLRLTNLDPTLKNAYNEVIVAGNLMGPKISGRLLLIEERFLKEFATSGYTKVKPKDREEVETSLTLLATMEKATNGRLKLALINTNMQGYKDKASNLEKLTQMEMQQEALKYQDSKQGMDDKTRYEKQLALQALSLNPPRLVQSKEIIFSFFRRLTVEPANKIAGLVFAYAFCAELNETPVKKRRKEDLDKPAQGKPADIMSSEAVLKSTACVLTTVTVTDTQVSTPETPSDLVKTGVRNVGGS